MSGNKASRNAAKNSGWTSTERKNALNSEDVKVEQDRSATMSVEGEARIEQSAIEVAQDGAMFADRAAELAFMEEFVEVRVHESMDPNAEPVIQVWNDGRSQAFIRGQTQKVRRKFVEVLARAKPTSYATQIETNAATGDVIQKMPARVGLRYPFELVRDENPRGREWLRNVLSEA